MFFMPSSDSKTTVCEEEEEGSRANEVKSFQDRYIRKDIQGCQADVSFIQSLLVSGSGFLMPLA